MRCQNVVRTLSEHCQNAVRTLSERPGLCQNRCGSSTNQVCSCLGLSHDSTPTASFDARRMDLLRPRPMHSCSLVQASTQMPTSLVVAAYERRCVRSTLERERRAAGHQCAAREPPGPESRRGATEHAQESTLADSRPQSGRQERAGGDAQKGLHRGRRAKIFAERVYSDRVATKEIAEACNLETRNLDTSTTSTRLSPREAPGAAHAQLRKPSKVVSSE